MLAWSQKQTSLWSLVLLTNLLLVCFYLRPGRVLRDIPQKNYQWHKYLPENLLRLYLSLLLPDYT